MKQKHEVADIPYRTLRYFVQDDTLIYNFLLGEFEIGAPRSSPFREDRNPSFVIQQSDKGNLYWVDYGYSNQLYFDGIGLVMEIYGVSRAEAINALYNQIVLKNNYQVDLSRKPKKVVKVPYEFEVGNIRNWELYYWYKHLVSSKVLSALNIHSLRALYRDDYLVTCSEKVNPSFIYLWEQDEEAFKSYNPLDPKGRKFRGQRNGKWIQGWEALPKRGEHLFITSSMKDVAVLRSFGLLATAPQSETNRKIILDKAREINARFDNVFILYDNDEAGIDAAMLLSKAVDNKWKPVFMPKRWGKDPAEVIKKFGNYFWFSEFFSKFAENKYHLSREKTNL